MVLGLIAVGVGSIAYEDGQAKRATVIDGGALDGPIGIDLDVRDRAQNAGNAAANAEVPVIARIDLLGSGSPISSDAPTKADVVDAMVKVDEAVL